jgi:hypothetical protein
MTRLQDSEADLSKNLDTAPVQNVTSNVAKVLEKQKEDKKKEVDAEGGPSKPKERKKKKSKKVHPSSTHTATGGSISISRMAVLKTRGILHLEILLSKI